jgi:hypothetical protein
LTVSYTWPLVEIQIVLWAKTAHCIDICRARTICLLAACCVCCAAGHDVRRCAWARHGLLFRLPCIVCHGVMCEEWRGVRCAVSDSMKSTVTEPDGRKFLYVYQSVVDQRERTTVVPLLELGGCGKGPKNIHDTDPPAASTSHSCGSNQFTTSGKAQRGLREARRA